MSATTFTAATEKLGYIPRSNDALSDNRHVYTNSHLLKIESGLATEYNIRKSFEFAIAKAKREGLNYDTKFKINVVANKEGKLFGYTFVWVTNSEIFYLLTGKNADGSDRYDLIDDPNWRPDYSSGSWADIDEIENPPQIRKPLPPLIVLEPIGLTNEQRESLKDYGYAYDVVAAEVVEAGEEYQHNVLCCPRVPEAINEQDIKAALRPYVSNPARTATKTINGKKVTEPYPLVSMNQKRIAYISFDPATQDAGFAVKMVKKLFINKGGKDYTMLFNRAYKVGYRPASNKET